VEANGTFNYETVATTTQVDIRTALAKMLISSHIPTDELVKNLGLFLPWQEISRTLFLTELYQKILCVPGHVMELGVRWGRNLALFSNLRATFEPFNHNRKIIGFDTFTGLPLKTEKDGDSPYAQKGSLAVSENHKEFLVEILRLHEKCLPYDHMQKFEILQGDVIETFPDYLKKYPETIVALAYFDLDLYEPTKKSLEVILGHLTKGSILAFDEVNHRTVPGETIAIKEVFGLTGIRLQRSLHNPLCGYFIIE